MTPTASGVPMDERTKGRKLTNKLDSFVTAAHSADYVAALNEIELHIDAVTVQRDALLAALEEMTPAMPPVNAGCHIGIVPQERCANCQRIARAIAALASVRNGGKS